LNITKIPEGKFASSYVTHYIDASGNALNQLNTHKVNLDSEDMDFTNKGAAERQQGAMHEFGHMIGLDDEYADGTPGVKHNRLYADALGIIGYIPYPLISEGTTNDIMSAGDTINKQHYVTFLEALKVITGMNNWRFK